MSKILGKIKSVITKVLLILAIVFMIAYGIHANIVIYGYTIAGSTWIWLAIASFALAFIVDGESASRALGSIAKGAAELVKGAGKVLGSVFDSVLSAIPLPIWLLLGGFGLYYFSKDDKTEPVVIQTIDSPQKKED